VKVLVTGASGFLGKCVVTQLEEQGCIVLTTDKVGACDYVGDLSDISFVKQLPSVDVVVHCAAVQYVTKNKPLFFWKRYFFKNNVAATQNLISHYEEKLQHFIHVGTSMQYRQNGSPNYSESAEMRSQGVYSWSKLLAQDIVDRATLKTATVIPCIIGGPGREGLFRGFVNSIMKYSIAIIPGAGQHKISIVHVEDVARLILRILLTGSSGKFNAAAVDAMSILEWTDLIRSTLGKKRVFIVNLPLAPISFISRLAKYRVLASEQLVMLSMPHVLDTSNASSIGAASRNSCTTIIEGITRHICNKSN
jgi:nucleoside-diphosphate-sugar epimerase